MFPLSSTGPLVLRQPACPGVKILPSSFSAGVNFVSSSLFGSHSTSWCFMNIPFSINPPHLLSLNQDLPLRICFVVNPATIFSFKKCVREICFHHCRPFDFLLIQPVVRGRCFLFVNPALQFFVQPVCPSVNLTIFQFFNRCQLRD